MDLSECAGASCSGSAGLGFTEDDVTVTVSELRDSVLTPGGAGACDVRPSSVAPSSGGGSAMSGCSDMNSCATEHECGFLTEKTKLLKFSLGISAQCYRSTHMQS